MYKSRRSRFRTLIDELNDLDERVTLIEEAIGINISMATNDQLNALNEGNVGNVGNVGVGSTAAPSSSPSSPKYKGSVGVGSSAPGNVGVGSSAPGNVGVGTADAVSKAPKTTETQSLCPPDPTKTTKTQSLCPPDPTGNVGNVGVGSA